MTYEEGSKDDIMSNDNYNLSNTNNINEDFNMRKRDEQTYN